MFFTVPQLAEEAKVDQQKLIEWIGNGELIAINVASNPKGQRPRWRVLESEWKRFLQARQSSPPAPPVTRRKRDAGVTKFY
jgi:hypothetical protein